jgi:hypothetical protein
MRQKLVDEYHAAVKAYSEAVRRLRSATTDDFEEAYERAEAARAVCEASRAAWLDYEKKSGP